tara:strand:- start:8118 stop:8759 length:642 start_codon:yes stop_codon:yes gene_type:complete
MGAQLSAGKKAVNEFLDNRKEQEIYNLLKKYFHLSMMRAVASEPQSWESYKGKRPCGYNPYIDTDETAKKKRENFEKTLTEKITAFFTAAKTNDYNNYIEKLIFAEKKIINDIRRNKQPIPFYCWNRHRVLEYRSYAPKYTQIVKKDKNGKYLYDTGPFELVDKLNFINNILKALAPTVWKNRGWDKLTTMEALTTMEQPSTNNYSVQYNLKF